ncbi:protein CsiD [Colwellia chukchiensis]|uniref:Protein CsiD n=1 Tax=Colwellia chukchiensis TaxID=641665 RepID=A0A1H7TH65_9GAMM|nr:glutarate dioxygenase GlaH [Colwellia chukchiensis]SEL83829.1 protein CsiD [Colwellia chukchiensis]
MNTNVKQIENEIKLNSHGFSVTPFAANPRLQVVKLSSETVKGFIEQALPFGVQAIEYKPFLRFHVADILNKLTQDTLGPLLLATIKNRATGGFMLQCEPVTIEYQPLEFNILLSTAVSHLIGVPNLDAMYGKFYARFSVKNEDNSDSYLRQAHRRMELHNDGTYVKERTDWVLMQKIAEKNMTGGDSLLLHVDDWQDLEKFYHHPLGKEDIQWTSPASKNIPYKIQHPVFFETDENGRPKMLFIDQFAEPLNMEQGRYLYEMGSSLESEQNTFNVRVPVGSMLVINNHAWLHGRDKFVADKGLYRELLRQRGAYYENAKLTQ